MSMVYDVTATNGAIQAGSDATTGLESVLLGDVVANYDDQIQAYSEEIQQITVEKNNLTEMKTAINEYPTQTKGSDAVNAGYTEITGPFRTYDSAQYYNLMQMAQSVGLGGTLQNGTDANHSLYAVSESTISSIQSALDNKISELNSSSEIKMINFQSLMDARKQTMLMLSNMVNADNQTKMAILQNLKS